MVGLHSIYRMPELRPREICLEAPAGRWQWRQLSQLPWLDSRVLRTLNAGVLVPEAREDITAKDTDIVARSVEEITKV